MKQFTLRAIMAILAAALIFGWFAMPSVWFWIGFETLAAMLVAIGCVGEFYLFHHPAGHKERQREDHHKLESRFIFAVAFGVTMELFALAHAIPAAFKLEKEVALANERASTNELRAEQFRVNALELESQIADAKTNISKIDPMNMPIVSATATVSLMLAGETNLINDGKVLANPQHVNNRPMLLTLCRLDRVRPGINLDEHCLICSYFLNLANDCIALKYEQPVQTMSPIPGLRAGDIKELNVIRLCIPALKKGTKVSGGQILLTVNSTSWNIAIPEQQVMGVDEDWVPFCEKPYPAVIVYGK